MASRCLCPFGQKHLFYFIPLAHYFYFHFVYTVTIADKSDKRRIKLRTLGINEIEDIALGASLLGAGGGGGSLYWQAHGYGRHQNLRRCHHA